MNNFRRSIFIKQTGTGKMPNKNLRATEKDVFASYPILLTPNAFNPIGDATSTNSNLA